VNKGKFVFAQLVSLIYRYEFDKCVSRYNGDYKVQEFNCWSQFLTMIFGQLTHRESIRDVITCLNAHQHKVYHLGISKVVAHSTLTRANENRDWRIYADFATYLIDLVRPLYVDDNDFTLIWTIPFMPWIQPRLTCASPSLHGRSFVKQKAQ